MKLPTAALFATLALLGLSACELRDDNTAPEATPGHATRTALDTQDKPIAGAKILLDNSVFYASYIHGSTGEDGRLDIRRNGFQVQFQSEGEAAGLEGVVHYASR